MRLAKMTPTGEQPSPSTGGCWAGSATAGWRLPARPFSLTHRGAPRPRWDRLLVLVGAATGPLALLLGGHGAGAATTATTLPPSPVAATGFAELFVAAWLNQADQKHPETLTAFDPYLDSGDLAGMTPGQLYAARTVAIDATQQGKNYWAVTVGAEVLQMVKGSLRPAGTRYYAVGIGVARGRYIAMSLPEQVPAPPTANPPDLGVTGMSEPDSSDPMAGTLTQFFNALLTGQGDLKYYVDPASGLTAIAPAPFTTITLRAFGQTPTGTNHALAKAQVVGIDAADHVTVLEYWLDMEQTQGRWEVARLHHAAPITGPGQGPAATTTIAPATTAAPPTPTVPPTTAASSATSTTPTTRR